MCIHTQWEKDFWAFVSSPLKSVCLNVPYHVKYLLRSQKSKEFQPYSDTRSFPPIFPWWKDFISRERDRERKILNKCKSTSLARAKPIFPHGAPWDGAPLGNAGTGAGPQPVKWRCSGSVSQNCPEDDVACACAEWSGGSQHCTGGGDPLALLWSLET